MSTVVLGEPPAHVQVKSARTLLEQGLKSNPLVLRYGIENDTTTGCTAWNLSFEILVANRVTDEGYDTVTIFRGRIHSEIADGRRVTGVEYLTGHKDWSNPEAHVLRSQPFAAASEAVGFIKDIIKPSVG